MSMDRISFDPRIQEARSQLVLAIEEVERELSTQREYHRLGVEYPVPPERLGAYSRIKGLNEDDITSDNVKKVLEDIRLARWKQKLVDAYKGSDGDWGFRFKYPDGASSTLRFSAPKKGDIYDSLLKSIEAENPLRGLKKNS
jgi:hypothetical protein